MNRRTLFSSLGILAGAYALPKWVWGYIPRPERERIEVSSAVPAGYAGPILNLGFAVCYVPYYRVPRGYIIRDPLSLRWTIVQSY